MEFPQKFPWIIIVLLLLQLCVVMAEPVSQAIPSQASAASFALDKKSVAKALSLDQFIADSLQNSDTVAAQQLTAEKYQAVQEEKKAVFLPTLNATVSALKTGNQTSYDSTSRTLTTSHDEAYTTSKINFSANLFKGFQDKMNLKAAEQKWEQAKLSVASEKSARALEAVQSFFTILQYESDERNQLKEIEINEKGLQESLTRVRNGNGRQTDVINMQSTLAGNRSDLVETQAALKKQKVAAARLLKISEQDVMLIYPEMRCQIAQLGQLFAKMDVEKKAELKAQKKYVEVQGSQIQSVKGQNLPSLDFTTSYVASDTQKNQSQAGRTDFGLTLTIPFPLSFENRAKVQQASKDYALAQLQTEEKRRDLQRDQLELVQQLYSDVEQIRRLEEAKGISGKNVEALRKDHRMGLSTYSEVLTASATHQQIVRRYDKALLQLDWDCHRALIWSADENQIVETVKGGQI